MEHYLAVKNKKSLPFATVWMDLENIMLSEISQSDKDKYHMISLIHGIYEQTELIRKMGQDSYMESRLTTRSGKVKGWGG